MKTKCIESIKRKTYKHVYRYVDVNEIYDYLAKA